ncbi:MAG: phospho-N-acetylmuramoyl-pentapeptide-transferase [Granulosicoccus sp.]|jgi:phospho-N-acetylmuramoyl-pentapeptide-transferase
MLYHLFEYIGANFPGFPGANLFTYLSFRAGVAMIISLTISLLFGGRIIKFLKALQIGETVRDLGLAGQKEKEGTPTMGGVIIIMAILIPFLLMSDLLNMYSLVMILVTTWLGIIGFADDYIKVFKKDKKGLAGKFKILGQVVLGLIVGIVMFNSDDIRVRMDYQVAEKKEYVETVQQPENTDLDKTDVKATLTNVPFYKNYKLDYAILLKPLVEDPVKRQKWAWIIFIPIVIFIVTAVSNAANLTDGIDGLATGVSSIIGATLGILAYVSSNSITAGYLHIMHLPEAGELVVFSACFLGACIGFFWYNSFPAQIFMGDTGSLTIGGIIAAVAILIRMEWLIPILCGIFVAENLSVMIQVSYFKYTRKKYGEGRRIFKMSPLHHHYQKLGMHESKIVSRFLIIGVLLAVLTLISLKIR